MADENFEREKLCYQQNFEQFRSLNQQMNQVPMLAVTLTGGLWFSAGLKAGVDDTIKFALLLFAGICNLCLVLVAFRIRDVMESYLAMIQEFHHKGYVAGRPTKPKMNPRFGSYSMITVYCSLMLTASVLSFVGAFAFYWPFGTHLAWWVGFGTLLAVLAGFLLWLFSDSGEGEEQADDDGVSEEDASGGS